MRAAAFVLVLVLVTACGGDKDGQGTPVDAEVSTGTVTLRLTFQSDVPESIFVQSGTEFGGQGWVTVRPTGGADLRILDDCGRCNCDQCDPCAVCGAGLPEVTEIPRGEHLDWTWNATVFGDDTCPTGGGSCERADPIPAGGYHARFCWSFTSDGVGPGHHVGQVTCGEAAFPWPLPVGNTVQHDVCACG